VNRAPYDVGSRIDPKATKGLCGSRYIDSGKSSIAHQKPMEGTAAVDVEPDNVASRVDPFYIRESRARFNDGRKDAISQQKTVNVIAAITIFARDIASRINP